jgi:hypothetical protein
VVVVAAIVSTSRIDMVHPEIASFKFIVRSPL